MSAENGSSQSPADLQNAVVELYRLHDVLRQTAAETSQLLARLNACQAEQQQALATLEQVQSKLDGAVSANGGAPIATEPRTFSDREATRWSYEQLEHGAQNEDALQSAFERDFALPAEQLITFLSNHRFFRKTGTADTATWMISGNRHDDLRDYLAE